MLLNFIPTIYHNVLRLLAMSSTSKPQWCEIPLGCVLIQVYCDRLQAQYNLEGLARMGECYVHEIKLYRVIGGESKHEYLVAKVRAPDGTSFFLAFERGRGETIDKDTHEEGEDDMSTQAQSGLPDDSAPSGAFGPAPETASQSRNHAEDLPPSSSGIVPTTSTSFHIPTSSSTLRSFDSSLRRRDAEDKVTFLESGKHKGKHTLFRTLIFPAPTPSSSSSPEPLPSSLSAPPPIPWSSSSAPPPVPSSSSSAPPPIPSSSSAPPPIPSLSSSAPPPVAPPPASPSPLRLYELAVLANTIHTSKPEYLLLPNNCYFYAGTIIKVLQERYHPALKVEMTRSEVTDTRWWIPSSMGKGKELKAGDWHHIEIYAGEKTLNTAPLIEKFEKDLADFKKPVQDHEDERKAKVDRLQAVEDELEAADAEIICLKRRLQDMGVQQE